MAAYEKRQRIFKYDYSGVVMQTFHEEDSITPQTTSLVESF